MEPIIHLITEDPPQKVAFMGIELIMKVFLKLSTTKGRRLVDDISDEGNQW